jgi:hypothetical protein
MVKGNYAGNSRIETMAGPHANLYNTGGIPEFKEPSGLQDARERINELRLAIMSIEDQMAYQQATGATDPAWLRKAATSRRFKTFELGRLENWLALHSNLSERIVEIVRSDYSEADWQQVLTEAKSSVG